MTRYEPRPEVNHFALVLETTLRANDERRHWSQYTQNELVALANHKLRKAHDDICTNNHEANLKHAADLGAYALMLHHNAERLIVERDLAIVETKMEASE